MRDLPAPVYVSCRSVRARGLRPRRGGTTLAMTTCSVLPSVPYDAVGPPNSTFRCVLGGIQAKGRFLSRLNTQPTRCPVNASPLPSRTATHDSGPTWFATPWLGGTCTRETYRFVPMRHFAVGTALTGGPPHRFPASAANALGHPTSGHDAQYLFGIAGAVLECSTDFHSAIRRLMASPKSARMSASSIQAVTFL